MIAALCITHTTTRHGLPLAVVDGLPGGHAELTPTELRALARALTLAAADCDRLPIRKGKRCTVREYGLCAGLSAAARAA